MYTTDVYPELSAARHVSDRSFTVLPVLDNNYPEELLTICLAYNIRMVIPTIDTELRVLAKYQKHFRSYGIYIIVSSPEFIEVCRDKRQTNEFFLNQRIETPLWIDKNNINFPLFVKLVDGSRGIDAMIVHSSNDLRIEHIENDRFLYGVLLSC